MSFDSSDLIMSASTFFLGSGTQFISGSGGNLEISSSHFHLSESYMALKDKFVWDGTGIYISSSDFYLGNPNTFISGSGGNIKISGSNVDILTKDFMFGNANSYVSGTSAGVQISGSNVEILTPTFYLGSETQFVSGSDGNIEISGSGFHVRPVGSGQTEITASAGKIGGASITDSKLSYSNVWAISASNNRFDDVSFISSSKFKVGAGGQVTASSIRLTGTEASPIQIVDDTNQSVNFMFTDAKGRLKFVDSNKKDILTVSSGDSIDSLHGEKALSFGAESTGSGKESIAFGSKAKATETSSVAIGFESEATSIGAVSIGKQSKNFGVDSVILGSLNKISGSTPSSSVVIGTLSTGSADYTVAIG